MINEYLVNGKDIYLFIAKMQDHRLRYVALGLATSHTFNMTINTIDVASNSTYVTNKKVQSIDYTINIDALYTKTDYFTIMNYALNGTEIICFLGDTTKDINEYPYETISLPIDGNITFFKGIITKVSLNSSTNDIATYSVTITGSSDITNKNMIN